MKTIFKSLFVGFLLIILNSCKDVVQIKLDQGSKLYVIDAFVNSLPGKQTIRVTMNDNYFSNNAPPSVDNATIVLKDLTANRQFVFNYNGNGNYEYNVTAIDTMSVVNHQYELDVTIGGAVYKALTTQKRTAGIDSISVKLSSRQGASNSPLNYLCTLWAKDRVDNNPDYYWIKPFRNDTLLLNYYDVNVCIDGALIGPISTAPTDSINFTAPANQMGSNVYHSGNTCKAEIHSLSSETYQFLLQAINQINNSGLFATTPENVKTNIVTPLNANIKAVGWFSMATVATATKTIP